MKHGLTLGVILIVSLIISAVKCHITGDKTYLSELKKLCEHAYMCFHDTVIVCGKSVNEARTFLDLCDMYEYACEYSMGSKRFYFLLSAVSTSEN
ncbi:Uncharacterized protein OBRU01_25661 [Operophtera brumata]|uniref:Uncharacterized protein n=1 Tax=Operophtera brumata TaxID=104452 RepID=A0A0L7K4J7_OPEBR|nr:Uncharacterized protein OBRU01_25661 [Operophtera brumata]